MNASLTERIQALLADGAPRTCDRIAREVVARRSDVADALNAGGFLTASAPLGENTRATYWILAPGASRPVLRRSKGPTGTERVLQLLSDGRPHSHHEIYGLGVVGHSRVADLRKRGHAIRCWREGDTSFYQLDPEPVRLAEPLSIPGSFLASQPLDARVNGPGAGAVPPATSVSSRGEASTLSSLCDGVEAAACPENQLSLLGAAS